MLLRRTLMQSVKMHEINLQVEQVANITFDSAACASQLSGVYSSKVHFLDAQKLAVVCPRLTRFSTFDCRASLSLSSLEPSWRNVPIMSSRGIKSSICYGTTYLWRGSKRPIHARNVIRTVTIIRLLDDAPDAQRSEQIVGYNLSASAKLARLIGRRRDYA